MDNRTIDTGKAIGYGWTSVKKDFWYLVGIAVVALIISGFGNSRDQHLSWGILGLLLSAWMTSGYMKMMLSYESGKKLPFGDLFTQVKYFWRVLGATLLLGLIVIIGFFLLIVPGIYLALRFQFTLLLILDKDLGILEAMKQSSMLTNGKKMPLLGFNLTLLGVIILGAIVFGVGIFVAMPVVWLATIFIYHNLSVSPLTISTSTTKN